MKKFNLNDYIYIQITEYGWSRLNETVRESYVEHCITPYKKVIDGVDWYRLQAHHVFSLFPIAYGSQLTINPVIMIDDELLTQIDL